MEGVQVRMRLHLVHHDRCKDSNEVIAVNVIEWLVVHVVLQRAGCIISLLLERSITRLVGLAAFCVEKYPGGCTLVEASLCI